MRIIAMYLPQFHRVKENDRWVGQRFTDWVSTMEAKPIFKGHILIAHSIKSLRKESKVVQTKKQL